MSERAQGRSEYRLCKDAKRDQRKDGQVTAKKRVQKERDPAQAGLPRIGSEVVRMLAGASCSRTRLLDLRRTLEQRVRLTKRPTNCTPIGKPDGVADLRLIPGTYFPTIETSRGECAFTDHGSAAAQYRACSPGSITRILPCSTALPRNVAAWARAPLPGKV